jgi:hypothetical protein
MPSAPPDDRRRTQRQWLTVPVHIDTRGARIDGISINVSKSGMYLFAAANLPVGSEMKMVYWDPNRRIQVQTCGIIRRRALYLYGIEFLHHGSNESTIATDKHNAASA